MASGYAGRKRAETSATVANAALYLGIVAPSGATAITPASRNDGAPAIASAIDATSAGSAPPRSGAPVQIHLNENVKRWYADLGARRAPGLASAATSGSRSTECTAAA